MNRRVGTGREQNGFEVHLNNEARNRRAQF